MQLKIITTINNPDFDVFASAIASQRLFKDHNIIFSGSFSPDISVYLKNTGVYFPYYTMEEVNIRKISSLVVIGTTSLELINKSLLGKINGLEHLSFIDNEDRGRENGENTDYICYESAACISVVTEKIFEQKINLSIEESKLFLTALYKKTNNFTKNNVKRLDFRAASNLISKNLNIKEISKYSYTPPKRFSSDIFRKLLLNVKAYNNSGLTLGITFIKNAEFQDSLLENIEKLWDSLDYDTLVVLYQIRDKIYFYCKTRELFDLNELLKPTFINIQKRKIAYGFFSSSDVNEVKNSIKENFEKLSLDFRKIKNIMTSPVRTVFANMTVKEVYKIINQTGHKNLPVIKKEKIVGIIRRKEIQLAFQHKLFQTRIEKLMTKSVIVINKERSIQHAKELFNNNNTDCLLVLENGILLGIVTTKDLFIREFAATEEKPDVPKIQKITNLINTRPPKSIQSVLKIIGSIASTYNIPVFVVGGFVRDLLLNRKNFDIDIVVEGNANEFTEKIADFLNISVEHHKEFLTSKLIFKNGISVDFASARTEYYERPAILPRIKMSTIKKDLYRRDFSINAMAIKLNTEEFGILVDFFNSRGDLAAKKIRILHNLSFLEDPTRILRGIRFEQRFDFSFDETTLELLKEAVRKKYLERVSGQRLREELINIFNEKNPCYSIKRIKELRIYSHLIRGSKLNKKTEKMFYHFFENIDNNMDIFGTPSLFEIFAIFLLYDSKTEDIDSFIKRYGFSPKFKRVFLKIHDILNFFNENEDISYSRLYELSGKIKTEILYFLDVYLNKKNSEFIKEYAKKIKNIKLEINGKNLYEEYKIFKGPLVSVVLDKLYKARLDGMPADEERKFVKNFLYEGNFNDLE